MKVNQTSTDSKTNLVRYILWGAILICLAMQFFMARRFEINFDEFYNLNMGYEFLRGEVTNPFQTIFFRFASWLDFIQGNEVDQIVAGRMFTYGASVLTCFFIYKLSRRYFSVQASLFAVLSLFSFFYVFRHMTAFRTDIIITMYLMAILWVVSDPNQNKYKVLIAGFLIGLSFTLALKSIFYMPVVAIFLLGRWQASAWSRQEFIHGVTMFLVAVITYVILFILHDPSLSNADSSARYLQSLSETEEGESGLFKTWGILVDSVLKNPLGWWLLILGFTLVATDIKNDVGRPKYMTIALLTFLFPLSTVIYYYHANAYFYPFMLAPAVIFIAAAIDRFGLPDKPTIFIVLIGVFSYLPVSIFIRSVSQHQLSQRAVLNAVHEIFPSPVPVMDYCGMISTFDRVNESGLFINPDIFGHVKYSLNKKPVMKKAIISYQPQIILANTSGLDLNQEYQHLYLYPLLTEDTEVLQNNYVKIWGPIFIPGQQLREDGSFEVLVSGIYTIKGSTGITIDGTLIKNGQTLFLAQGMHELSGLKGGSVQLVWGDNLKKPDIPEPTRPLFHGF